MKNTMEEAVSCTQRLFSTMIIGKNIGKEDTILKLRSEAKELDEEYRKLRSEFDEKERQQHEAFNVSYYKIISKGYIRGAYITY